jgi:hypothetical protein
VNCRNTGCSTDLHKKTWTKTTSRPTQRCGRQWCKIATAPSLSVTSTRVVTNHWRSLTQVCSLGRGGMERESSSHGHGGSLRHSLRTVQISARSGQIRWENSLVKRDTGRVTDLIWMQITHGCKSLKGCLIGSNLWRTGTVCIPFNKTVFCFDRWPICNG